MRKLEIDWLPSFYVAAAASCEDVAKKNRLPSLGFAVFYMSALNFQINKTIARHWPISICLCDACERDFVPIYT